MTDTWCIKLYRSPDIARYLWIFSLSSFGHKYCTDAILNSVSRCGAHRSGIHFNIFLRKLCQIMTVVHYSCVANVLSERELGSGSGGSGTLYILRANLHCTAWVSGWSCAHFLWWVGGVWTTKQPSLPIATGTVYTSLTGWCLAMFVLNLSKHLVTRP